MKQLITLGLLATLGCATSLATRVPPPRAQETPDPQRSLFRLDAAELTDEEIIRILETRVELPPQIRIALLYWEHRSYASVLGWRSEERNELRLAIRSFDKLRSNDRVYDVSYLPDFLLPDEKSIALVRSAAARYQADWILVFRTETQSYKRNQLFRRDKARSYCVAECAVIDTRTGIIPFTSLATHDFTVEKAEEEWSLTETVKRAELAAIEATMTENVENLLRFLDTLSARPRSN